MEWEDLENLRFEFDGEIIQLEDGQAVVSYGGASEDRYTLQNRVGQGDLNGDGFDDVVAHIVLATAGTGTFHLVVAVIDNGQGGEAQAPVRVGDRIVMDRIEVRDRAVEVVLFDREPDEPFTVISRRQMLEIDFADPEPTVAVIDSQPLESLPPPGPDLPEIDIRFDPGAIGAIVAGSIDFRQHQTYTVYISAGQWFTATLDAPLGVWLDVRLEDHVVASGTERFQHVQSELPATGPWKVTVVSAHAGAAEYKMAIEALPPGSEYPVATTPTESPDDVELPGQSLAPTSDGTAPVVYFTFDDGPHPVYTPQVLDVLAKYNARATFFVVGSLAEALPRTTQRIVDEGHTLANHTWNHENLAGLPREEFDETVGRTQAVLGSRATNCLRPPYGSLDAFTREWAAEHGLVVQTWDYSPEDWLQPPAAEIAQGLLDHARNGAILLLHDGGGTRTQTVLGLDMALQELTSRGFRFEPLCT